MLHRADGCREFLYEFRTFLLGSRKGALHVGLAFRSVDHALDLVGGNIMREFQHDRLRRGLGRRGRQSKHQRRRDGEQALWDALEPAPIVVADTFHPAEVDTPKPKPIIKTVAQSRSLPALINGGIVMVAGVFTNALAVASDYVGWALGVLPSVATELQMTMSSGEDVAGALQIPWSKISAAIAVSCIALVFVRELQRKRETP